MGKAKKAKLKKHQSQQPYRKDKAGPAKSGVSGQKSKQQQKKPAAPKPSSVSAVQTSPPLKPDDRILLVGEGDFSFSHSLHTHHGCTSLTATTFETRDILLQKYPQSASLISALESHPQHTVLYSIDATKLGQPHTPGAASLRRSRYDAIVFNFPHVGGKSTDVNRQVRANQALVVGFLESAKAMLAEHGRVLLTVFEGQPYELWGVRNLARHAGFRVERSMRFEASMYPGYSHARTLGNVDGGGGWKGEDRRARMFIFVDRDEVENEARQKSVDDSDEDE